MHEVNWWNLLEKHMGKIVGGLAGLLFALPFAIFGFWKGLFVIVCIALGIFIGARIGQDNGFRNLIERLFPPRDDY